MAAAVLKAICFVQLKTNYNIPERSSSLISSANKSLKYKPTMATLKTAPTVGLSETFSRLKQQGKVALIPYITAGDPDLATTAEALKVLDSCGSDIIELGVPYSDPLADGPVIQVVPQLSCPIALFSYYNPILKRGVGKFMITLKDTGVHGLVVPDVPLEETEILRKEAINNNIELVSSVGVTGARASVSEKVQSLLQEIKEATSKPVAVGFGISKPEHVKQVAGWGADGVIVGSAIVKLLGEAKSPEEGLKELEKFTKSLKSALL
ncbi:hypothetical protein DH2020_046186 [Rehmannia glutinosa]|uniref:tryptophan synthase n=1 Tax=Rehmannia glutinosa TaxID=99300 RepID=A0ABR0UDM1_REHGL